MQLQRKQRNRAEVVRVREIAGDTASSESALSTLELPRRTGPLPERLVFAVHITFHHQTDRQSTEALENPSP